MTIVKSPDPKLEAHFEAQRQRDLVEQQEIAAEKERLRILNVYEEWIRTRQLRPLSDKGVQFMDEILATRFNSIVTLETLDRAYQFLVAKRKLRAAKDAYLESRPELNTVNNKAVGDAWVDENPTATLQDFVQFIEAHRLDRTFEWFLPPDQLENLVRVAKGPKLVELRLQYGKDQVDEALARIEARIHRVAGRHNWANEKEQEREEARRKQELSPAGQFMEKIKEMNARNEAETIVSTFRGASHADSQYGREILSAIVIYKDDSETIDWRKTADARRERLHTM